MATGENVLWIIEKRMIATSGGVAWVGPTRLLFRTRRAARLYSDKMNAKAKDSKGKRKFSFSLPIRCVWGPDN